MHCISPLLFVILLRNIVHIDQKAEASLISSFADDTKINKEIKIQEDTQKLQKDTITVYTWAKENNMLLIVININSLDMERT